MIETFINGRRYHVTSRLYDQMGTNKIVLSFTTPSNLFFDEMEYPIPANTNELLLTLDGTVTPHVAKIEFYNGGGVLLESVNLFDTTLEFYPIGKIQFDGTFLLIRSTFPLNTNLAWEWMKQATWEYFSLNLYNLTCEKNVVTKTSYLTNSRLVNGQLEEETDITKPSVLLDTESWIIDVFKYNYAYIPLFKRYYFIDKIVSVRMNVYRIYLSVDVLYTYDSDIRLQDAFISRCEDRHIDEIVDNRFPLEDVKRVDYHEVTGGTVTFDVSSSGSAYSYLIDSYGKISSTYSELIAPTNSDLPNIDIKRYENENLTVLTKGWINKFYQSILPRDDLKSYIKNVLFLPFDITSLVTYQSGANLIINNDILTSDGFEDYNSYTGTPITCRKLKESPSPYIVVGKETITGKYGNYLDYEPFTKYEFYMPFVGWFTLNAVDILNQELMFYYSLDYDTGLAQAYVYNLTNKKIIYSSSCQLGLLIPLSTTNALELTKIKQNNTLNFVLGLVSSGVSLGVGAVSGNPLALVGGAMSGAKTIANYVNANNLLIERMQVSFGSSESAIHSPINKVVMKTTYPQPINTSTDALDIYAHLQGLPLNEYINLTGITGYTEIGELHYTPSTLTYITKPEMDEIVSIARDGIIL